MPTVADLRKQAESLGLTIPSKAKKADIVAVIEQAQGEPPTVEEAVWRELDAAGVTGSALGAAALALAREMDGKNSATSKSMCGRALIDTLDRIRELHPPTEEADPIDELDARRAARRAAAS